MSSITSSLIPPLLPPPRRPSAHTGQALGAANDLLRQVRLSHVQLADQTADKDQQQALDESTVDHVTQLFDEEITKRQAIRRQKTITRMNNAEASRPAHVTAETDPNTSNEGSYNNQAGANDDYTAQNDDADVPEPELSEQLESLLETHSIIDRANASSSNNPDESNWVFHYEGQADPNNQQEYDNIVYKMDSATVSEAGSQNLIQQEVDNSDPSAWRYALNQSHLQRQSLDIPPLSDLNQLRQLKDVETAQSINNNALPPPVPLHRSSISMQMRTQQSPYPSSTQTSNNAKVIASPTISMEAIASGHFLNETSHTYKQVTSISKPPSQPTIMDSPTIDPTVLVKAQVKSDIANLPTAYSPLEEEVQHLINDSRSELKENKASNLSPLKLRPPRKSSQAISPVLSEISADNTTNALQQIYAQNLSSNTDHLLTKGTQLETFRQTIETPQLSESNNMSNVTENTQKYSKQDPTFVMDLAEVHPSIGTDEASYPSTLNSQQIMVNVDVRHVRAAQTAHLHVSHDADQISIAPETGHQFSRSHSHSSAITTSTSGKPDRSSMEHEHENDKHNGNRSIDEPEGNVILTTLTVSTTEPNRQNTANKKNGGDSSNDERPASNERMITLQGRQAHDQPLTQSSQPNDTLSESDYSEVNSLSQRKSVQDMASISSIPMDDSNSIRLSQFNHLQRQSHIEAAASDVNAIDIGQQQHLSQQPAMTVHPHRVSSYMPMGAHSTRSQSVGSLVYHQQQQQLQQPPLPQSLSQSGMRAQSVISLPSMQNNLAPVQNASGLPQRHFFAAGPPSQPVYGSMMHNGNPPNGSTIPTMAMQPGNGAQRPAFIQRPVQGVFVSQQHPRPVQGYHSIAMQQPQFIPIQASQPLYALPPQGRPDPFSPQPMPMQNAMYRPGYTNMQQQSQIHLSALPPGMQMLPAGMQGNPQHPGMRMMSPHPALQLSGHNGNAVMPPYTMASGIPVMNANGTRPQYISNGPLPPGVIQQQRPNTRTPYVPELSQLHAEPPEEFRRRIDDRREKAFQTPPNIAAQVDFGKYLLKEALGLDSRDPRKRDMFREGFETIRKCAEEGSNKTGNPEAQYFLAECYRKGAFGAEKNSDKAFGLYTKASKQSHYGAMYQRALCYELGQGIKANPSKAITLFRQAATGKITAASLKLGIIYMKGMLKQKINEKEGLMWLKQAAAEANTKNPYALYALLQLGLHYEHKKALQDRDNAFGHFLEGAELGYPACMWKTGTSFRDGIGTKRNQNEADRWFREARARGILSEGDVVNALVPV